MLHARDQDQPAPIRPELAVARTLRAVCENCGAHAAVVATGASITGSCTVCGGTALSLLDEVTPPPRRWSR